MWRLLVLALWGLGAIACGDDSGSKPVKPGHRRDAAVEDSGRGGLKYDAKVDLPGRPMFDAAVVPGDPPPELGTQACAVDTNKLYEVASTERAPEPSQVAVDQIDSRFGLLYVDKSDTCFDAVYLVTLEGPSDVGEPKTSLAVDACSTIERAALTHSDSGWLIATVDGRVGANDIWVQGFDGDKTLDAYNVTESTDRKSELAITTLENGTAVVAWVDNVFDDMGITTGALHVRMLNGKGQPTANEVVLQPSGTWSIAGLSLSRLGKNFIGVGYRRSNREGTSEIVLETLDLITGEAARDPWVLSTLAGGRGSVDLATDGQSGGVIYSVEENDVQELWFQLLGKDGLPAPIMSGINVGGPRPASRLVGAPQDAVDASLTLLPTGFAVAYRVLAGVGIPQPRIRVHFLNILGEIKGNSDVALATDYGGRTAIKTGFDGRVVMAWSNTSEDGVTKNVAVKLPCFGAP